MINLFIISVPLIQAFIFFNLHTNEKTTFLNNNKGADSQAQSMVQFNDDIFVYSCLSSTNTELPLILLNVTTKEIIEEQNDINFNGELVSTSLKVFSNNIIVNVYIQFVTEYSLYIRIYSYSNETGLIIGALCFTLTEYGTGIFRYQEVDDLLPYAIPIMKPVLIVMD